MGRTHARGGWRAGWFCLASWCCLTGWIAGAGANVAVAVQPPAAESPASEPPTPAPQTAVPSTAAPEAAPPQLEASPTPEPLDAQSAGAAIRDAVGLLRQRVIGPSHERVGLIDDDQWQGAQDPHRWVVLVHGFASGPDAMQALKDRLDQPGIRCRRFAYPNDGPVSESSQLLSRSLRALRQRFPERRLTVISHSMGSLVTRNVLESPELDPGNVDQFIMIAPPNHGSHLAQFPIGLDVEEFARQLQRENLQWIVRNALEGAIGSAQVDLRPESEIVRELNGRPRNPAVRYTIFAGTAGPFTRQEAAAIAEMAQRWTEGNRVMAIIAEQLIAAAASNEVIEGRGDGCVSVESATLAGVTDFVSLPFRHHVISRQLDSVVGQQLIQEIVSRIVL
ncbi:lipase family alpha/beta hydrolase [Roseimaritima sediminicola]|uniref:lipase family alpha/beta hydrolase n=1 Tax=Roseimaritima sediminicola TaxID=2662066 RepID=UPI00129855A9|nr:alpha/beta hydrolase [Roseimaritima sediminicola]